MDKKDELNQSDRDYGPGSGNRLVDKIIVSKKRGVSDEDIAEANDNDSVILDDLIALQKYPHLSYHYKHAVTRAAWEVVRKGQSNIFTLNMDKYIAEDLINSIIIAARSTR